MLTRRSPSSTRATWAWSCPRRALSLGASSSTLCAPRSSWPASTEAPSQVVTTGSEPQHTPAPGHRLRGRPARGSVETKVAQRSGQLALQWRLLSAPAHASSSGQPRPVSCLGRAGRLQHRSPSQHSSPSKEITYEQGDRAERIAPSVTPVTYLASHGSSSQHRHEAGAEVDSRTLWGELLC